MRLSCLVKLVLLTKFGKIYYNNRNVTIYQAVIQHMLYVMRGRLANVQSRRNLKIFIIHDGTVRGYL